jgi:hypothetical protein
MAQPSQAVIQTKQQILRTPVDGFDTRIGQALLEAIRKRKTQILPTQVNEGNPAPHKVRDQTIANRLDLG